MELDERVISAVVRRVMDELEERSGNRDSGVGGVFSRVEDAVAAAELAQRQLMKLSREKRGELVAAMREAALQEAATLAEMAVRESKMGRVADKTAEHRLVALKTPGIEDLETEAKTGDHGLTVTELSPFGVIGAITPVTNPAATVINNSIGMIAAGNAVVFSVHPAARLTSTRTVEVLNQAIVKAGGPPNLICTLREPSIETAEELMTHPKVNLIVATGGPGVVRAALSKGKRAIGAGAGNPPAMVDGTCDVRKAGRDLVLGAGFDNNLPCIAEKAVIVVDVVADALMKAMEENGARRLSPREADRLTERIFTDKEGQGAASCSGREDVLRRWAIDRQYVGKNAEFILREAGINVSDDPRIAFMEVDRDHPLVWHEQMMPILPIVRVPDVDEAIRLAVEVEGGNRHTAVCWSRNVDTMTRLAREIKTTIFVKNGPSYAGIGFGGEGHTSFTIAGPTGEGLTSARTFTRRRRCVLVDAFSIV